MKTEKRRWAGWLPGALVSLGLLAWLLWRLDLREALQVLWQAQAGFLLAALAVNYLWLFVRARAWQIAQAAPIPFAASLRALSGGYLLNVLLPFRLGEVGRAYLLGRQAGLSTVGVFSTVVVERLLDLIFSSSFMLASLAFVALDAQTQTLAWGLLLGLSLALAGLTGAVRWRDRWLPGVQRRLGARAWGKTLLRGLNGLLDGLSALFAGRRALRYLFWVALSWALAVVQFWFIVRAFVPQAAWWWGMFLLAATAFGLAIPSLPGAIGTLEAATAGAVYLLTGQQDLALAVGLTMRLNNYATPFTFGLWALAQEGQSLPQLYQTLRRLRQGEENAAA